MRSTIYAMRCLLMVLISVVTILQLPSVKSFAEPKSNCYVLDKNDYIYDFTNFVGKIFEYEGKDSDLAMRFCNDVQDRSNKGYIDFGHFQPFNYFKSASGAADFVQEYYFGDLQNCEQYGYDKMGRTAKVNIVCGNCSNGVICKDPLGCICNVSYHGNCRVFVELAISCGSPGPRIFRGFTIGYHPRAWEVVYNGITQWGYETAKEEYSFGTEQAKVSLFFTAVSSLSKYVGKPFYNVHPDGLEVKLSGSASTGRSPTTLSPTVLDVNWQCKKVQDSMYFVNITVPIEGYQPINFYLGKLCEYKEKDKSNSLKGWAKFGIFSCIFIVLSTALCCASFIYKTRVQHQRGIFALPGMTVLDACLEVASGDADAYASANDTSHSTWDRSVTSNWPSQASNGNYGTV